jgi:hypothetical protein
LDDAWIHAVYARELARSGMLAYNPGIAATGETSPLWAVLTALVHKAVASGPSAIALTKMAGFGLHAATAVVLGFALRPLESRLRGLGWIAAAVVAFHPDLIAASVSGMEVPLATLVCALIVMATLAGQAGALFLLGGVALVSRPETAIVAAVFPALFWMRVNVRTATTLAAAGGCGGVVALAALGWRNHAVSGLVLPATFHVKANRGSPLDLAPQTHGFVEVLGHITALDSALVILALAACACVFLARPRASSTQRGAGALITTGLVFCSVSFFLVPPADPAAFYHQRYVLPALPLLIAAQPFAIETVATLLLPRFAPAITAAFLVVLGAILLTTMPGRAARLDNDAHNIDDVQVEFGRALAAARDTDVLWAVDAGAARYFGRPFVVDLVALNTPELLGAGRDRFLSAHPPNFLDVFPGWSEVSVERGGPLPSRQFSASTAYTVTSAQAMRMHVLATCEPPDTAGWISVRGRQFKFVCPS